MDAIVALVSMWLSRMVTFNNKVPEGLDDVVLLPDGDFILFFIWDNNNFVLLFINRCS